MNLKNAPNRYNYAPGCCGFLRAETAASWGGEIKFGFVANNDDRNEVGIAEKICVGYKGEFPIYGIIPSSDAHRIAGRHERLFAHMHCKDGSTG